MSQNRSSDPSLLQKVSSEVSPEVSPLMLLLLNNAKRIAIVFAIGVIGAAGYGIYNWRGNKQITQAQNDLGQILVIEDSDARLKKLKAFQASAPARVKPAVALAIAKSAMIAGNFGEAEKAWGELARDAKDPLYATAVIGKAESLSNQGKAAEALAALETMSLSPDNTAVMLVDSMIVDFAEKSGNLEKAVAASEKIAAATMTNPEEADFWRQKAAYLRGKMQPSNS